VRNGAPTRKVTVQLLWGKRTPSDYYAPQVIIAASEGRIPYPLRIVQDSYAVNLLLSAQYSIRAEAFCQLGTKGKAETGVATVAGQDLSTSVVTLTFAEGECAPR
jgi:hypothetical protein